MDVAVKVIEVDAIIVAGALDEIVIVALMVGFTATVTGAEVPVHPDPSVTVT